MQIKKAIVTGALGFVGWHLTDHLLAQGIEVTALLRPGSPHCARQDVLRERHKDVRLTCIFTEIDESEYAEYRKQAGEDNDVLFDLAWGGGRHELDQQMASISRCLSSLKLARELGCSHYIGIGSQAEYGVVSGLISEESPTNPFCAYGAAKLSTCHLSRIYAKRIGMKWNWARIFSVSGEFEPEGRMLPDMIRALKAGKDFSLSSCRQDWDYLDARDCASALFAIASAGRDGEIYNVANGAYRPLKDYVEEVRRILGTEAKVIYGADPEPFVSLAPSVDKLKKDTGWRPVVSFEETVRKIDG